MFVPFDERFGGVINRFKEHSRYLNECAKVANFKMERERYEDLKRSLELLVDAQQQQRVDLNAMAQTGHDLRDALMDARANIEKLLKEESESLRVSRKLEERATTNFQERIRGLDGAPRDDIELEKKRHTSPSQAKSPVQQAAAPIYMPPSAAGPGSEPRGLDLNVGGPLPTTPPHPPHSRHPLWSEMPIAAGPL